MSLNLPEAWKSFTPPSPSPSADDAEEKDGVHTDSGKLPVPETASSPLPEGAEVRKDSPASAFPRQAVPPLSSPVQSRSLFESLSPTPFLSGSRPSGPAYRPDPRRMEELHALILHDKKDPELDALLERNPAFRAQAALDDGSMPSRAALGQQILREIAGEKRAGEPGLYFLSIGEKLPEAATRQEAYAAVYDHYAKSAEKQYEENKARRAAYQANRAQVEEAVAHVVGGLWSPAELGEKLTPEQIAVYQREFDVKAIEKAHTAFTLLKQTFSGTPEEGLRRMVSERTAMQITSALSDDDGAGKLTINETAFSLFESSLHALMEKVKEDYGDQYRVFHNLGVALFDPAVKRDATLRTGLQLSGQQNLLVPFARDHNAQVFDLMSQTVKDYETYVTNDRENARVLGLLSTGQDLGNAPNDRASLAARTVNCLGSVTGQTLPFFIPYAGWGVALAGAYDDKRNRAYYDKLEPGTAEWSAFIDAAASVAVEKISYGAIGKFSGVGRLMGKLPFMSKAQASLTSPLWKKVLFETGAGIAEETLVEPTAEAIIQWAVRNNLAPLAGVNVGGTYDWNNYWNELKGMLEPGQLLATALFVGGLAGMQAPSIRRAMITHSKSAELLMTQGVAEDEARRISNIADDKERLAAVEEAVGKVKTLPPEQALRNSQRGVQAFKSLAEVRATVESEAYKFFQQDMRLPLVEERLDKPRSYNLTVFDRDSGQKKFTQEMDGEQLAALFGQYFSKDQRVGIAEAQSAIAANAFLRKAEERGGVQAQDMLLWGREEEPRETDGHDGQNGVAAAAPHSEGMSTLGKFIRTFGMMNRKGFSHLTQIAMDEWNRRLSSGIPEPEAASVPFAPLSPYAPLGSMAGLEKAFNERLGIAAQTTGEEDKSETQLFQMKTAPGTTPADILFLVSKGLVGTREMLEDLFEVGIKHLVRGTPARLEAMGSLLRETQAGLQKLGFRGRFIEPDGALDEMRVIEAMSKLALSDMLVNVDALPLPQWQKDLLQYHVNFLQDAACLLDLGKAWNAGRQQGTITQDIADILRDLGHQVHTVYDQARIEQQDIQAVMEAYAIVGKLDAYGVPTAAQIREWQKKDAQEEQAHITTGDRSRERTVPKEAFLAPESVSLPEAPESMQGVFFSGAAYNPDAGTWIGLVSVDKLHLSPEVPQVKVNSGKKGVVNPLVGEYRADAPPVYIWKRRNGKLEVVSGRHRLDLAQRTMTRAIPAYVYEEDANHDARWARLLDYEQNMQDDQADELTAAIYVRETGLSDAELTRRGLTRAGTKSRRGLLIGREAREDLWTRFRSGAIRAQDAEAICLLTRHIRDKARVDAMQMTAANDLANGKTLDFVAAKIQLMAHASADGGMVQGLISFGESFEQDMERAAEYVARCISVINEHINAIKGVRNISKKGNLLATEGITAGLSEDPAERLRELELLKAMYEKIGLYENLRVRALTWDGHIPPDPIGDHRLDMQAERARAEEEAAARDDEESRKAAEDLTSQFTFSLSPSRSVEAVFPSLWRQAAKELNVQGHVSFALNGSRVAVYTFPEKEIRTSLDTGGMVKTEGMDKVKALNSPANRSEAVPAGKIVCILHPESFGPSKRKASKQDGSDSGKQFPLSDFSGFTIPSSLEESLYPALRKLGVPVRVYNVTEEEAAFLEDPRSMEKDAARRKGLEARRNNVIRSFLEETDVSFSLSPEERRIAAGARRENTWMLAPDGTPTALTERQWLQVHSEDFKRWFGESKIVNGHGEPVIVYHGTARADRVGAVFRPDRATSGPMAFFTDHENIASNYARDKADTSIAYEEENYNDYRQQFRVTLPSGRDIPLERYWHHLSPAEQRRIATLAGQIREDWENDDSIIVDPSINDANGGFPYHLQEARGNAFRALVYHWLEAGTLFNQEHRFLDVLAKLNLPIAPWYRDPDYREPKVYACYMRMEHPFRTDRITKKMVASLKAASRKADLAKESWRADFWDKNSITPEDWIERLEHDHENKTTHAWASIPDWVTAWLRRNGYDGIIDQGGKFHADEHTVCIPFDSVQLKSATDNRGTFDSSNPDITFSLSPEENLIAARAKADGSWMKAPNGQTSHLTPKLWTSVRTKAFMVWFGDWIHAPEHSSRVTDDNGEPLVVYHGTNKPGFTVFDNRKGSPYSITPENSHFFTPDIEIAASYSSGVHWEPDLDKSPSSEVSGIYPCFLNLRSPLEEDFEGNWWDNGGDPWYDLYDRTAKEYVLPPNGKEYWESEEAALLYAQTHGITNCMLIRASGSRTTNTVVQEAIDKEHDGAIIRNLIDPGDESANKETDIYVALRPEQIKSATRNRGTFDSSNPDITFSLSNLAAVHSLDADKLLAADKLGGLPLPSLAVTRLDKPYTWGEDANIYLIGSPALADPARGVEIHDRDMWSGQFPELRWNRREEKERDEFYQSAEAAARLYYGGTDISALRFLKNALDGDHRGALEHKLRHNDLSLAVFAGERGYSPRPLTEKTPGRLNTGDKLFYAEIRKMLPEKDAHYLHPDKRQNFCAAMERAIERCRESSTAPPMTKMLRLRLMEKELKEARGDHFDIISFQALQDARFAGKSVPNWQANYKRFEKYAATRKKAFNIWVQDKMERWFNPMPRIRENGFPATLENLTRYMLRSKGAGMERGLVFSTGLLRAKQSRRFDSLDQIKESRDNLVTTEENHASRQKAQDLIHEFQTVLNRIDDSFQAFDNAVEALSCVKGEPTQTKVRTALSRLYRGSSHMGSISRNAHLLELGARALNAIHEELRDYYEAVPQRAVELREFSRAVLPVSLKKNKQVRDILKRHGIRPLYHDGTLEGRTRAFSSLIGSSASFSLTPGPSMVRFPTSEFMTSLSEEERAITEKALASGMWLKAPNGENSRLTPRQWVQTRTAAFKNWFGDWEEDAAHASRIVDDNGEPRVVYHGTPVPYDPRYGWLDAATYRHMPAPFSIFGEGNWNGAKFFFDDYDRASSFASGKGLDMDIGEDSYTFECFLNVRKLFNVKDKEELRRGIDSFGDAVAAFHPWLGTTEHVSREEALVLAETSDSWTLTETEEFQQRIRDLGYDGFSAADRGDYYTAVIHPGQIKSATENAGSFDPASPDITFSVIGPRAATWKRYEEKAFPGRDDGRLRAEIDASQAIVKDSTLPYRERLQQTLASLRASLPKETRADIKRYLSLHRQFYKNKRTLNPEKNIAKWHEYLSFDKKKESWEKALSQAFLQAGLCHGDQHFADSLAYPSLNLLLEDDEYRIERLTQRGLMESSIPLEEWLDYPELFAAYPELRALPVLIDSLDGYNGFYSRAQRAIYLNRHLEAALDTRSILLHEVQHAIQHIEGFARGGTSDSARRFYEAKRKEAQEIYDQATRFMDWLNARDGMISTLTYMLSLARNPRRVLRTSYRHSYDNILHRLEGEERILDMARYALQDLSGLLEKFYDESRGNDSRFDLPWPGDYALNTPSGIRECLQAARATPSRRIACRRTPKPDLAVLHRNVLKYEQLFDLSSHELYLRLAGEIEARNVQQRMAWTAEGRAAEPFNATLEYPGESLLSFSMTRAENRPAESFLSSLTEEERALAARTWEDGTWLLAPNGQSSRLTPRQWLQVRTASFRNWFGDWEHDPLEASRVVDDHGEPLVVYHGSRHAGFTIFDGSEGISHSDAPAGSAFFTDSLSVARSYSGTREEPDLRDPDSLEGVYSPPGLYPCFLNLRDPWEVDFEGANWDGTGQPLFEFYDNETEGYISPPHGGEFWNSEESIREYAEANGYTDYEIYDVEGHRTTNTVVREAMDMGMDGAVLCNVIDMGGYSREELDSNVYVAFRPEQVKSATQNRGTFDPRNPDITFSLAGSLAVQQSITSADTSMRQVARTFGIVRKKLGGWKKGSVNIDIGGGKYNDFTQALEREEVTGYLYDPFARHASHNAPVLRELRRGRLKGDTVTCSNVLNVIPESAARCNVIRQAAKSLKPEGTAWFCVYEGDGSGTGRVTKTRAGLAACWQENRKTASYLEEIRPFFGEVEMKHGLIMARAPRRTESPASWRLGRDTEAAVSFSLIGPRAAEEDSLQNVTPDAPPDSSFSLTSLRRTVSSLTAPSMQATRAAELVRDFDKAAENWRRVMSAREEQPSARVGAELFGMINSLISSARYVLPKGYRSRVDLQMQWASVYAAMAENGEIPPKGTLQSGDSFYKKFEENIINKTTTASTPEEVRDILAAIGSQRLDYVMGKVLDRVSGQLIYFAKDELYEKTMKRVEAVYPKKEPGKKSPRGRLEAAAYRAVIRYRKMLDSSSEVKTEALAALETLYNREEDEEQKQEHERDILAWKTYGDYAGMSLPQAREAMKKLLEFVLEGRNSWDNKLKQERGRAKYTARQIQKNLPAVNSSTSRAGARIGHRAKLRKLLSSLPYSFMSYSQLMLALEPILGQRFSRARVKEMANANAALLNASNDRSAWLSDTIRRIAGAKSESAAEQWLVKFDTPEKTGIPLSPVVTVKVSLPIEEAQDWLSLSKEERDARRREIRENDKRTETLTENVPEEEDILLLRQELDTYGQRSPEQQQHRRNIASKREVPNEEAAGPLTCSRDCALYAILLHEQDDYADVYDEQGKMIRKGFLRREGFDDEGIAALYEFVGPDGLEYGYELRKRLNEQGIALARVYEERMGVPFTLKKNYFRATFDRNSTREKDALTEPATGPIGGGKYGLLIDRIVHTENLDFSRSGTLVFLAASAEQDNYMYTSHITAAWRALLKNKTLEQKLRQRLGEDIMGKLSAWMDLIDGASLENNRAFLNLSRMQGMLQKAFAVSVLAGNGYVLLKQSTAILHGFFAGWVPSGVLERADGTRELSHRHISFSNYLFHLAGSKLGLGDITVKELAETPCFTARMRGPGAMLAQIGNQTPGQRYSRLEKLPEKAMDLIEWVDVKANLHAMHALANAYYAKAKALNEENGSPFTDEQLREAALEQVGMSLELGAQPLTKTQKSMSQAAGGILSRLAFVMKSEQLNKIGLMAAEWQTGSARNRVCAAQSWLSLGVTSALLAWLIAWIKGMDDDDDEKKWKKYGATVLLGDLTTIPLAGEAVNTLSSLVTGERVFADSYSRTLIDVQGIARAVKKEYEHVADKKEMDWDTHFNNLTALVRAAGVGGAFSRSSSAVISSYGALSLSAATGANISRTAKDLLTRLFGTPEEDRKKKKKKRKSPSSGGRR